VALRQWGEAFLFAEHEPRSQLLTLADGQPLAPLLPQDRAGRVLSPAATHVVKPAAS